MTDWNGPTLTTRSHELRAGREITLKALYSVDVGDIAPPVAWQRCQDAFFLSVSPPSSLSQPQAHFMATGQGIDASIDVARHMLQAIAIERMDIDTIIRKSSKRWRISRMQPIERNILRIGTFELIKGFIPARDVIYDCVELAKFYGDEPTPGFINGILDQICQDNQIAL